MKKILTTLVAVIAITHFSYAQWTRTAPYIFPSTITDKVGIGTATPTLQFEVHTTGGGPQINVQAGTTSNASIAYNTTLGSWAMGVGVGTAQNVFNLISSGVEMLRITSAGKVGICTDPTANLHVKGINSVTEIIQSTSGDNNPVGLSLQGGAINASWSIATNSSSTSGTADDLFIYKAAGTVGPKLTIKDNGMVGIGTNSPDEKLTVKGKIHSQEVIVDSNVLPDYVFDSDYDLKTLTDVKAFIDKNHHLPEIPSAKEVAKDGLKLGDMNNLLLKKVEELTLYLIDQNKQLTEQQKTIKALEERVDKLTQEQTKN